MSNRIGMIYNLVSQNLDETYKFEKINICDINELAASMLEAFIGTEDYEGETLEDLSKEIFNIFDGHFGMFISNASFQIKQNNEIAAAILISLYKGNPLISELFTTKKYLNLGMASNLLKKSINTLLELGYESLILYVHPKNQGAINLYKKIGFVEL